MRYVLWCAILLAGCAGRQEVLPTALESVGFLPVQFRLLHAAHAIAARLDPAQNYRPWFLLRGRGGIPVEPEHASWDLGDMTGRYLEGLILTRRVLSMTSQETSEAEQRLQGFLLSLLGPDGLVHDPATGAIDHSFSQGSALYGLLAWYKDSGDPAVRVAAERLISGQLRRLERRDDMLVDPTVKLPESSGSHLAGYQIFPAIRFYELTGYPDALALAEGLTRWALADPVLGSGGEITKALSWEGHIHSWLDTLAGCVRTARNSAALDRAQIVERARSVYEWVKRTNATSFGWFATYPTGGSCETCAISSAIRLSLELAASGLAEYYDDVERFVRNQVGEAQFVDLSAYSGGPEPPTPLLLGCFDSQSMPNGHLGTRGGEDVGTVEGCCLNGGIRAIALALEARQTFDGKGLTVNIGLTDFLQSGPSAVVTNYQPREGRIDVVPREPCPVRIRIPPWVEEKAIAVTVNDKAVPWTFDKPYLEVSSVPEGAYLSVRYPLRDFEEEVTAGGQKFRVRWRGDTVVAVDPPGAREPTYQDRLHPCYGAWYGAFVAPRSIFDAARLAASSMLARMDLERGGQPFFRIYPFAKPPRAEHEKWDDGDMTGRYVEALILARRMTGMPMDPRETILRTYLASLFDPADGLCYTRETAWTPRRACLFSQSSAMLGLLAWHRETGSRQARALLDRHVDGLMRIAVDRGDHAYYPKYEYDGKQYVDDPKDKDAPTWYGGRLILPLVEYWQLSGRDDVKRFLEKLIRHSTEISKGITTEGEVRGNGWWGHLHSTMDMAAGIAEFGRLTKKPELVAWAKRVYEWIGRTHTTRYGWVADCAGSHICESCAISSRIRLGLALYRAGVADPFGEIDRHVRNQLLENQFRDLSFLEPLDPARPRTDRAMYAGIDAMIRGTFQCWGTANDLIGHDDIEGCGAGGGVQGLWLAWKNRYEWRDTPQGKELRIHLLFDGPIRAPAGPVVADGAPIAAILGSDVSSRGILQFLALQDIPRLAVRLPDGADASPEILVEGRYAIFTDLKKGRTRTFTFPLKEYETVENAHGATYKVKWRGSSVISIDPPGTKVPLYSGRAK